MSRHILVADDSVTIQRTIEMTLGRKDVRLTAARSYEDALAAARRDRPDLVLCDLHLGARSGYDLCASLKADASFSSVPVLMLASTFHPYDEARGRSAGAL